MGCRKNIQVSVAIKIFNTDTAGYSIITDTTISAYIRKLGWSSPGDRLQDVM